MIPKQILIFFSAIILISVHQVYGAEELPVITIDFITGNTIDLDDGPQMIRADIQIQNYNPQDGYHYMQIIRLSDGEILKDTEILPKFIDDDLFGVQVLHYLDSDPNEENLMGDYEFRIYSEFGSISAGSVFYVIKSSMPTNVTSNTIEELVTPEVEFDLVEDNEELEVENLVQSESKIPSWVRDIFVWYGEDTISENELLEALGYLIAQGTINVNSD